LTLWRISVRIGKLIGCPISTRLNRMSRRLSKKLMDAVRVKEPDVDEHDLRAIAACLAASPEERARRLDADRWMLMQLRGLGKERIRYFKNAESYQRWQNQQPDVGGWQWDVLQDRLAGKRPFPRASRKSPPPSEEVNVGGEPIPVASLEDIIASKEAANRAKDRQALPVLRAALEMRRIQNESDGAEP